MEQLSYSLPETGTRNILYQTACQMCQKLLPVFGANFSVWYVCHWYKTVYSLIAVLAGMRLRIVATVVVL